MGFALQNSSARARRLARGRWTATAVVVYAQAVREARREADDRRPTAHRARLILVVCMRSLWGVIGRCVGRVRGDVIGIFVGVCVRSRWTWLKP